MCVNVVDEFVQNCGVPPPIFTLWGHESYSIMCFLWFLWYSCEGPEPSFLGLSWLLLSSSSQSSSSCSCNIDGEPPPPVILTFQSKRVSTANHRLHSLLFPHLTASTPISQTEIHCNDRAGVPWWLWTFILLLMYAEGRFQILVL